MSADPNDKQRETFRPSVDREVDEEIAFHLAMRARELAARGSDVAEAERVATAEFGDLGSVKRECRKIGRRRERHVHRMRFVEELAQDIRFAARMLRRRPAYATLAIATIALGIGAATGVFSVVDGVLLRDLPFADPGRLVAVWIAQPSLAKDPVLSAYAQGTVFGSDEYFAVRDHVTGFQRLALWTSSSAMLAGTSATEEVTTVYASASLLPTLGEQPVLGRGFLPDENILNGPKVALVSWETWRARFGGDSAAIGRSVKLDDDSYTIVGVLPQGLRIDRTKEPAAFWLPALQRTYDQPDHHNRSFRVIGRLEPNVSAPQVEAQVARAVRAATRDTTLSARVENWQHDQTRNTRAPLLIILAASGLLLLIACVNVAMLALGESASREREFAARIALGAGAMRVVRQLLVESMTIALAGAAAGSALAWGMTRALVSLAPSRLPGIDTVGVDLRVLLFAIGCAGCAGVIFGLAPALSLVRSGEAALARIGAGQSPRHSRATQRWFVATEIALSLVLLVGAALLSKSLAELGAVDPGFRPADLTVVRVTAPSSFYNDDARRLAYYDEAVRQLGAIPGVESATGGSGVPFASGLNSSAVTVEGRVYDARHMPPFTEQRSVYPDYFALLGIPLRAGRVFTTADSKTAELVAVISEAAARRDFPGESPIGRLVKYQGKVRRIVGVVGDVRTAKLSRDGGPAIYVPLAQHMSGTVAFVLRTRGDIATLAEGVRLSLRQIDPTITVASVDRLPTLVAASYGEERYRTAIVAVFAALAAMLASIGLYGVTLRAVSRRTREMGIRMALGATPATITRLLMLDSASGVVVGAAIGLPLAILAGGWLSPYLFRVTPGDPAVFGVVLGLLVIVAGVASALPARRAGVASPAAVLVRD